MANKNITLYQAVEDRNNRDEVEQDGPYKCVSSNAWLGAGYYFWDTNIRLAHWWGKTAYKGKYMVCRIDYTCDYDAVFDLVGDMAALQLMKHTFDFLNSIGKPCTVSGVIEYLKRKTDFGTKYIAVRAKDEKFPEKDDRILFISGDRPYLNLNSRIQLCFFDKSVFNGYEYKIVYPNEYATVVDMTDMTI